MRKASRTTYLTLLAITLSACRDATMPTAPVPSKSLDVLDNGESATTCVAPMTGVFDNVIVPAGGNCKLIVSQVNGWARVLEGGSLEVLGSRIEQDVIAESGHLSLGIGGIATGGGIVGSFVGGDVRAKGTVAVLPNYGVNYLCNTRVEHNVIITDGSAAAPWDIGLIPFPCTFGNSIGGDLRLLRNDSRIRIANNTPAASPNGLPGSGGIGGNIQFMRNASLVGPHVIVNNSVAGNVLAFVNAGGVAITANQIERNLLCENNEPPAIAAGNVVGGQENCER